jgi:hypothetical protein
MNEMKIVLFEDTNEYKAGIRDSIARALANKGKVVLFEPIKPAMENCVHAERIKEELVKTGNDDATLIVADSDLSALESYGGLSEPSVRRAADILGIPECCYARGEKESHQLVESAELREARIALTLDGGNDSFAQRVVGLADGFKEIRGNLPKAKKSSAKKSPGALLAEILKKPEYAEKISLYASGDRNRLASVLRVPGKGKDQNRWLSLLLGYWLWDSVLRFPGLVVDEVAAASYLNISVEDFRKPKVRGVFNEAIYSGPFAGALPALWWRGMLDDLISANKADDGNDLVKRKVKVDVRGCMCRDDPRLRAGYYCMLSKQPVSLEKSKPGLAWFPRGADLARISNSMYEEKVPWL